MKHSCKLVLLVLPCFTMWAGSVQSQTQKDNSKKASAGAPPSIGLSLEAVHDVVHVGSPVEVQVTLTNISGRALTYIRQAVSDHGGFDYKVDVHDENGSVPPDTKFRRALKGREDPKFLTAETPLTGSLVYVELKPGQTLTNTVDVTRLYDLTKPGKYVIQVTTLDQGAKRFVKSNTFTVTVAK